MTKREKTLEGKRLGIVGKGGAGKSTVTVLVANALQERGYKVCILDADSTNVGLHQALNLENPPASLIDFYGGMVFSGGAVTCPVDDPTPLPNAEISLSEIPRDYYADNQDGITLLTAGKIGDLGPGAGCDGPINKIARDVRIRIKGMQPVTLVDFKAGFEDSARGAITGLDWVLVVVDPTMAAIQMAIHMKKMVEKLKAGALPATEHLESLELKLLAQTIFREAKVREVLAILNRVNDEDTKAYIQERLLQGGVQPIGTIMEDSRLMVAWLKGFPLESSTLEDGPESIVKALEELDK